MFQIQPHWDKLFKSLKRAVFAVFLVLAVTFETSFGTETNNEEILLSAFEDTSKIEESDSLKNSEITSAESLDVIKEEVTPLVDSIKVPAEFGKESLQIAEPKNYVKEQPALEKKSVLYLSGGERSPWFFLGVLYAIEEYGIPIDSVVGTSWGAWVGYLWTRGVPVDEIQRIMLDSSIVNYVGYDLITDKINSKEPSELNLSPMGIPALRQRFTVGKDSSGEIHRKFKTLEMDTLYVMHLLAKVRFQEALYRQRNNPVVPFSVQGCDGSNEGNSVEAVINSLPLWKNATSGELCPHFAMPIEDEISENSIIVVADPLRKEIKGSEYKVILYKQANLLIENQPGIIIRAHTILDTAQNAWIQAGFSAVERKLTALKSASNKVVDYKSQNKSASLPWFKFTPSLDSVSSELHTAVKSHWDESDTGLVAPLNFAKSLQQHASYDSLDFYMQPSGELLLGTVAHPTFDLAAGGFGSNVIGANAYIEASVSYVSQIEMDLALKGFWGSSSYGFQPRLEISKLWNKRLAFDFGFDLLTLRPLKSFNNDIDKSLRIYSEFRSDFLMSVKYLLSERQTLSLDFLFGNREYELDSALYGSKEIKTHPISPEIHYNYTQGNKDKWFALQGLMVDGKMGLESIGFSDGISDVIPIYWKLQLDSRYAISLNPFVTFSAGVSGGIERYHDEGYGYVSPKSFGYAPLDVVYRFHGEATPWTAQWNDPELSSHEYALVRCSGALHNEYIGLWIFAAYFRDFEDNPYTELKHNKFILEPAIRFAFKSIEVYAGVNRVVDKEHFSDLKELQDYTYFIRVGNYEF